MCLIVLSFDPDGDYPLVVVANRDEFHDRPTQAAAFWANGVLAGRDLLGGGTWMGVTRTGRFAAVTNYREAVRASSEAPSRGGLVTGFLESGLPPTAWLEELKPRMDAYNGFSLLTGVAGELAYLSNREGDVRALAPGTYGMSNHLLETPWPKVVQGKQRLESCLRRHRMDDDSLLEILADSSEPGGDLPLTGHDEGTERLLAPPFIVSDSYGTRATTLVIIDREEKLRFVERSFDSAGRAQGEKCFGFPLEPPGGSRRE